MACMQNRRDFLKGIAALGVLWYQLPGKLFAETAAADTTSTLPEIDYKYKTMSVDRLADLKIDMDRVLDGDLASKNETFRSYVAGFEYTPPKELPNTKSIVIVGRPLPIIHMDFCYQGKVHRVVQPTGYASTGLRLADFQDHIRRNVLQNPDAKLEFAGIPIKLAAARSGLGQYGLNNICFIDGYGSFHDLWGFYTDQQCEDNWGPVKMMHICKGCDICIKECPTQCITAGRNVIDVSRCVTLYNELADPFPEWMEPSDHNALVGCVKCQFPCPANEQVMNNVDKREAITEAETEMILSGGNDEALVASIKEKLAGIGLVGDLAHLAKNLRPLLGA